MASVAARRWTRLTWGLMLLLALAVTACAAPGTSSGADQDSVDCAKLASLGVHTCPPANPRLATPKVINGTGGQVSNSRFNAYVRGYLRNDAYQTFAIDTSQAAILRAGILSTRNAIPHTFGPDLQYFSAAAAQGGNLSGSDPVLTSLRLVVLPTSIQNGVRAAGLQASRLGWVATYGGPAAYFIVGGSRFEMLQSVSNKAPLVQDLLWGTYQPETALGEMWQLYGLTGCSADPLWETLCQG